MAPLPSIFRIISSLFFCILLMNSCETPESGTSSPGFDLQGHRGARGLLPENSLPAFKKAMELGVNTLELDLAVSADSQLVVSHEPWFNAQICQTPEGDAIDQADERMHNIFQMPYSRVKQYDCGSLGNPRFPEQQKVPVHKPLLSEVIEMAEGFSSAEGTPPPFYNIEIKTTPEGDGIFHPMPHAFSELLFNLLEEKGIKERVTVQSFDFRVLQYWHVKHPGYSLAALVENGDTIEDNLERLGFTPDIYSPWYKSLTAESVKILHSKGIKVVPWTVNETAEMQELLQWGVDGIITDYPNRALLLKGS